MKQLLVGSTILVALSILGASGASAQLNDAGVANVESILADYEIIRDALANDRSAPIAAAARRIQSTARGAAGSASGPARAQLRAIASKARALAGAGDLAAMRRAFGRLSEPLVTLVKSHARLRRGRHLFDCPMAEGYGEWIQNDDQISNPYMGQRMLTCGAARDW